MGRILHSTGEMPFGINGENKSVPHRQTGLTLVRMKSTVISVRKRRIRPGTKTAAPAGARVAREIR